MCTYVVEDKSKNITDLISYLLPCMHQTQAYAGITAVVSTQSPVKQLIIDALVCARENGATMAMSIRQYNIESDILASLSFEPSEISQHFTSITIDIMKFHKLSFGLYTCEVATYYCSLLCSNI